MVNFHVIAEAQGDGVVNMRRVGHRPNLPETVHHVTLPVNEDMVAVIWWPDRLPSKVEQAHNDELVRSLQKAYR